MEAAADLGNLNSELREAGAPGSTRANPIALEVRVNATGARPSQGTEKRELFSEDTQTAVVFPDAAVISLTAAVVPGQLVFLTNKENNREVVCQVIRKRNNRPTSCYVELQFTEPQKDFWGVAFPETPGTTAIESPVSLAQPVKDDAVSAEVTEEPPADPVAVPKTEEVDSLRQEVEALREQLKALTEAKKKEQEEADRKAAEAARKAQEEADAAIAALAAKRDAAAKPLIKMNLPAAPVASERSVASPPKSPAPQTPTPLKPPQPLPNPPAKPVAPVEHSSHSAERDAFEDLLPKPELDFSNAPVPGERPDDDRYSIYKPLRKKVGPRDAILVVAATLLLAGGIGFAWYKDLLPMARRNATAPTPAAAAKTTSAAKPTTPATSPAKGTVATPTPPAPASQPAAASTEPKGVEAEGAEAAAIASQSATEAPVTAKPANQRSTAPPAPSKKRTATTAPAKPAADAPEPVAADAPVLPAKLVRAAKPVYPPHAMRNFITGDVRITAEVAADGHVGKVTVISGPAALRAAAVDAMKQYEYEPATKGGKPVPCEVTTTIKFWFDP
ncbi:MAG TPA: TonB family protein [Candidatus Acidoferrum sp.]